MICAAVLLVVSGLVSAVHMTVVGEDVLPSAIVEAVSFASLDSVVPVSDVLSADLVVDSGLVVLVGVKVVCEFVVLESSKVVVDFSVVR